MNHPFQLVQRIAFGSRISVQGWRRLGYGLIGLAMSLFLISVAGTPAWGQNSPSPSVTLPSPLLPSPLRQWEDSLSRWSDLLASDSSEIARDGVWLDGRRLFTIAVPVLQNNAADQTDTATPVESRVRIIEDRLRQIIERGFDPNSLEVTVENDSNSRQPVVYVSYSRDGESTRDELLTVTALDAQINGTNTDRWAGEISDTVEVALLRAEQERQPEFLRQQGLWAWGILLVVSLMSAGVLVWQRRLRHKRKDLSAQSKTNSSALSAASTTPQASPESTTVLLQRRAINQQKQRFNDIQWRLSQLIQLLLWGAGLFLIVGLFPYTRWVQPLMVQWIQIPIRLLVIVLLIYLAIRLSEIVVDRLFWALQSSTSLATNTSQRLMLRFNTFSQVAKSIVVLVWGSIGVIAAVSTLGVEINPALLTLTGIVGVGISLASQNLIKDVINGFLILLEDQYGVGDVVMIGNVSGFVENLNLRITQLRSTEGQLITIPNSSITIVQNLSKEWSRVDLSISVAHEANLDQALAVTEKVANDMSQDPAWQDLILEKPQLLGVDNLDYVGATIRLWIKTQPLKQWDVAREYRRRLKFAFDKAHIPIGIPQQSLWLSGTPALDHPPVRLNHQILRGGKEQEDGQQR
jgi:moderate conductance mechanosensitive channel